MKIIEKYLTKVAGLDKVTVGQGVRCKVDSAIQQFEKIIRTAAFIMQQLVFS